MTHRRSLTALVRQRIELRSLVLLLMLALCGWAFLALADEVMEGGTHAFDEAILLALRNPADPADPIGPGWVEEIARDVTALGSMVVLGFVTFAVAGYLVLRARARAAGFLLASVLGGVIASSAFKAGFDRPRPDLVPHATEVYTASFPSGHSMLAAVTYLTLAVMLSRIEANRALRVYVVTLAVLVTIAVGTSRVYLGVHWPTDVLAGWAAGSGWALACWLVARTLQQRGALEPEGGPD